MDSQFLIKSLLALGVVLMGVMLLRNSGGAKHMAGRRIVTLAFVVFALVTIAVPSLTTYLAHFVGVGRGTDLLLYALVLAFLASLLSSFRRASIQERRLTKLARAWLRPPTPVLWVRFPRQIRPTTPPSKFLPPTLLPSRAPLSQVPPWPDAT